MTRRMVIAVLSLCGIFIATYLTLYKLGYIGTLACGTGVCERVPTSRWAVFLGPRLALGAGGHEVSDVPNGQRAFKLIDEERFDAVFLDWKPGAEDGRVKLATLDGVLNGVVVPADLGCDGADLPVLL